MKNKFRLFISLLCLPVLIFALGLFVLFPSGDDAVRADEVKTADVGTQDVGTQKVFSTERDFQLFVNNYGLTAGDDTANITITKNFDMTDWTLNKTIGTKEMPFKGTFNGNGYAISNISLNLQGSTTSAETYLGFFGYVSGAKIEKLQINGTYKVSATNVAKDVYAGMLVGYAEAYTEISMCYVNPTYTLTLSNTENLPMNSPNGTTEVPFNEFSFGTFAGNLTDSSITNCIASPTINTEFVLGTVDSANAYIGGFVGNLNNAQITFDVSKTVFRVTLTDYFTTGNVYVGGLVGMVSQRRSLVRNCVTENTITYVGNSVIDRKIGLVGGYIGATLPAANNISYVYYFTPSATSINTIFYNLGEYCSAIAVSPAELHLTSLNSALSSQSAYEQCQWYGGSYWNFDDVWTMNGRNIALQTFSAGYSISVQFDNSDSASTRENVLAFLDNYNEVLYELNGIDQYSVATTIPRENLYVKVGEAYERSENQDYSSFTSIRYGTSISFKFKFNDSVELDDVPFSDYYTLSTLTLNNDRVVTFGKNPDGSINYVIQEDLYPDVTIDVASNIITVTISSMSARYSGNYSISIDPIEFTGVFEYRLYNADVLQVEEPKRECYVTYSPGGNTNDTEVNINTLTYHTEVTVTTGTNSNSIYLFVGWYLDNDEGEDELVGSNPELTINFGSGKFVKDFVIYARYDDDARVLVISMGEGIRQISISTAAASYEFEESGTISLPKEFSSMTASVYVEEGYTFDSQVLVDKVNTYKGDATTGDICQVETKTDEETGEVYYVLTISLEYLNSDSANGFIMEFTTVPEESFNWMAFWIIIGVVAALIVAAIIVVVIVVIKKRGGGYAGGGSVKSTYKGMYF